MKVDYNVKNRSILCCKIPCGCFADLCPNPFPDHHYPDPDCCPKPRPDHHDDDPDCRPKPCKPRKGELVRNGGFEAGVCNAGWECTGNVQPQDQYPDTGHNAHQGTGAVALGLENGQGGDGSICQVVDGICPHIVYEFSFFMSPHSYAPEITNDNIQPGNFTENFGNGEVRATLKFLDCNMDLINGSKEIFIPRDTLALANVWTYYRTIAVAPEDARYAQIKFAITDPQWRWQEHVHIDDVSLVAIG